MNFYFDGHGSPQAIGDDKINPGVNIGDWQIAASIGNHGGVEGPDWKHPYRFVFLNACQTADNDHFAHAFGIPDRITSQDLNSKLPQAYLGWVGKPRGPVNQWLDPPSALPIVEGVTKGSVLEK
ncbi:MAG: hypothetical protein ABSA45_01060 [Verrucomicrobiota bacterium]|jgi:hypothetical protein